ncbi:Tn3 family transposase [Actinomadura rubrisoli]|uniref:Tn3 family transposase n=1 Tax=Actinomadura rubrisoli TaxID=2530368 RepID=UPI0014049314|nr:Tn3 family transposase [Actinomadura rubrisoli]
MYALGTNVGVKRVAGGGRHGQTEAALRATRHLFVNRDNLRNAVATLAMRDPLWWGNGTACASDSKKSGSWSSNLMIEDHARYGGHGVMIYWHVDRKSVCVYSQYDQMVKYATALRLGTAEAEQVLRRFTRGGPKHPTHKAIEELGKAVKSVFAAEYVASQELRREIHEGLQVVENWNSANTDLFYGSAGAIGGSDNEHQEASMLSLHLLQSALVFINTLLVRSVLKEPAWQQHLTDVDKRGLSPLFWSNANLYGTIDIDLDRRLDLGLAA